MLRDARRSAIGMIPTVDSGNLVGMFEHFTDGARRVLVLAQGEALSLHDSSIGPEHLLLGMSQEAEGLAGTALSDAGVDANRTRALVEEHKRQQAGEESDPEPFSGATLRIMERSVEISWDQTDGEVDTGHLLVALLEQGDETTEAVLAGFDVTPEELVRRVDALLAERAAQFGDRRRPAKSHLRD